MSFEVKNYLHTMTNRLHLEPSKKDEILKESEEQGISVASQHLLLIHVSTDPGSI